MKPGVKVSLGLIRWSLTDYTHGIQNMSCSFRILTLTFHADVGTFSPRSLCSMEISFISKVSSRSSSLWEVLWNVTFPVLFTDTLHHQPARTNCIESSPNSYLSYTAYECQSRANTRRTPSSRGRHFLLLLHLITGLRYAQQGHTFQGFLCNRVFERRPRMNMWKFAWGPGVPGQLPEIKKKRKEREGKVRSRIVFRSWTTAREPADQCRITLKRRRAQDTKLEINVELYTKIHARQPLSR